ncbi:hypothetical protein IW261DRAFT_196566 [Armillaria novae-zelandiae]|uniref:Alpha/beta hydrolase fold-3 domain-containing protein n=1 Tax=Armillaria novae-zelandiae TaxID=153914 RepID=A0AA39P8S2_9AGAR|nr:hypothetical protein IW261DRAFT_196566 [Armillaria novae-zelandiae]
MRNAGQHTDLMDIPSIRLFMGTMGGMGPAPPDALVTPVTSHVKKRRLRGILEEFDRQETGKRELSGEWVVGKRTWNRLQTEWKAAQIGERESHTFAKKTERVMLYIHGGEYINCKLSTGRARADACIHAAGGCAGGGSRTGMSRGWKAERLAWRDARYRSALLMTNDRN